MIDCIIGLTSWSKRIKSDIVKLTIYSLLKQSLVCNYRVVLVLSKQEFPNENNDLPVDLVNLINSSSNAEILYTNDNTKSYKKYFPIARKYPNIPIITVDDDSLAKPSFLPKLWAIHTRYPTRVIYGYNHNLAPCASDGSIKNVRYGVALYPPNSLYPLDEYFGRRYFQDMDDEFMKLLHVLNGTKYCPIDANSILYMQCDAQDVAMGTILHEQWNKIEFMWRHLWESRPDLYKIWKTNSMIANWS